MPRPSNASHTNTASLTESWQSRGVYTGAGAANIVKVRGKGQSVTRQGVGLYTVTFTDVGGQLAGLDGVTHTAATVAPQEWKFVPASYSATTKSVQVECWSAAGALADPPASALVELNFTFFDNVTD